VELARRLLPSIGTASLPPWSNPIRAVSLYLVALITAVVSLAIAITWGGPGTARLTGPALTARLDRTFEERGGQPRELAFSPDGRLLATSSPAGANLEPGGGHQPHACRAPGHGLVHRVQPRQSQPREQR
jgi:hypothetical protein